jgi:chaperonin GroEL
MNESVGYSPKDLKFGDDGRLKLISGITKISNAVKSTLGPRGNTVLIESPNHTHGITVTKDGVTVAKAVELLDPVENLAVKMMKEAADRTATLAGDGTTTSIVLTEALVKAGDTLMTSSHNRTEVLKYLVSFTKDIVGDLSIMSKPINKTRLLDVATISANNDKFIGKIIADTYNKVGKNGIVTIERSQTSETYYETTEGLKVDRGYVSPLFINNHKKDECILEDVHILVSDAEINNILSIEGILKPIIAGGKKLLIIAPCSTNVTNTLAANVMKNNLKICAIPPPNFGYKQNELMQDIAISVGATYFSEKTGDDLSLMTFNDLGFAKKIVADRSSTIIVKDKVSNSAEIKERVSQLWDAHANAVKKNDKDFILSRIASLSGGVGVIFVGGNTDLEQKELYDRVDDAVCAVRSALLDGILPGGGVALYDVHKKYDAIANETSNINEQAAAAILAQSLCAPLAQILANAGLHINDIYVGNTKTPGYGFDVKEEVYGDMISMGIIDPMKVTKSALENAVSVAATILSTNAIITLARSYETN